MIDKLSVLVFKNGDKEIRRKYGVKKELITWYVRYVIFFEHLRGGIINRSNVKLEHKLRLCNISIALDCFIKFRSVSNLRKTNGYVTTEILKK